MRGDRPFSRRTSSLTALFTPHAQGSTPKSAELPDGTDVYPACAGIDRLSIRTQLLGGCLPRMRGDRPQLVVILGLFAGFTPHARGSTPISERMASTIRVYPACAGIDRYEESYITVTVGLPRMRGDRPSEP